MDDGQTLKDVLDRGNTGLRLLADRGYDAQANRELLQAGNRQGRQRATRQTEAKVASALGRA